MQINESLFDPRMAPAGKFTAKVLVTAVPYDLAEGTWDDPAVKDELANNVIDTITEYAPNFRDAVIDRYVFTPLDFERVFGNYNWAHVDVRPDEMFGYRPMPGWSGYQTRCRTCTSAGHRPRGPRCVGRPGPQRRRDRHRVPGAGRRRGPVADAPRGTGHAFCLRHVRSQEPSREGVRVLERPPEARSLIPDVTTWTSSTTRPRCGRSSPGSGS